MSKTIKSGEEWLSLFSQYQKGERAHAGNSIEAYAIDLGQFKQSLQKDLMKASPEDIRRFILDCLNRENSPRTARRKLSAIRSFYQFVYGAGGLAKDPSRYIRGPKLTRPWCAPSPGMKSA
jgi:site-specific recombinase XerD